MADTIAISKLGRSLFDRQWAPLKGPQSRDKSAEIVTPCLTANMLPSRKRTDELF